MANIGEPIREYEVVPYEVPVESPEPAAEPVREDAPDRELVPAGAPSGQLPGLRGKGVSAGLSAKGG